MPQPKPPIRRPPNGSCLGYECRHACKLGGWGPKHCLQLPPEECDMLAVCQIWNGEGSFPQRSLPDKALELPRVRPGRSHIGFGLGARFLIKTSYYSTTARKQPTEKWAKDFGRHFSKDDEEPISTWKGAPHHQKYQSKRRDHTSLIWAAVIKKKKKRK